MKTKNPIRFHNGYGSSGGKYPPSLNNNLVEDGSVNVSKIRLT